MKFILFIFPWSLLFFTTRMTLSKYVYIMPKANEPNTVLVTFHFHITFWKFNFDVQQLKNIRVLLIPQSTLINDYCSTATRTIASSALIIQLLYVIAARVECIVIFPPHTVKVYDYGSMIIETFQFSVSWRWT